MWSEVPLKNGHFHILLIRFVIQCTLQNTSTLIWHLLLMDTFKEIAVVKQKCYITSMTQEIGKIMNRIRTRLSAVVLV